MPLPLPNLDDRRWNDLVEESQALIPRYAPAWTDHNIHDPGITLMELFAWLAEMDIYRLNQVLERQRRKFLALIGFNPRPPQVAETILAFTPDVSTAPFVLKGGMVFETGNSTPEAVQFRTQDDLTVVEARLTAVQVDAGSGLRDRWRVYKAGLPFDPFGPDPQPGAALYLGFDKLLPVGEPISLGFHFTGKNGFEERRRLIKEVRAQAEAYRRPRPGPICEGEAPGAKSASVVSLPPHHSVSLAWEFFDGQKWVTLEPEAGEVVDDTRSLTIDGTVRLTMPTLPKIADSVQGDVDQKLCYLRCRLASGRYDAAPQLIRISLNAVIAKQSIPVWRQLAIAPEAKISNPVPLPGKRMRLSFSLDSAGVITNLESAQDGPQVGVLEYKAPDKKTSSPGFLTLDLAWLGVSNGAPEQQVTLPQVPVEAESLALYTLEQTPDGKRVWRAWQRREELDASQRTDAHYALNPTTGEVTFGNGERGRVPEPGALLLAAYHTTCAEQGNVPVGTVTQLAETLLNKPLLAALSNKTLNVKSTNPMPAVGGAAAETVPQATGRAVETLWAHERLQMVCSHHACQTLDQIADNEVLTLTPPTRAVNTMDCERFALDVPGTQVYRSRAWSNLHPDYRCRRATGVVCLVVVPALPLKQPQPTRGLRKMVRCYLDHRRVVTTRIEVVGPHYLEVRIQARLQSHAGVKKDRVREAVVKALNRFLDPLRGGPSEEGWPFGRDVYRSEILQLIDNVAGVDYVDKLLFVDDQGEAVGGNLCVDPTWLVTPGKHQIEVK